MSVPWGAIAVFLSVLMGDTGRAMREEITPIPGITGPCPPDSYSCFLGGMPITTFNSLEWGCREE